jgi:hypothetical protein
LLRCYRHRLFHVNPNVVPVQKLLPSRVGKRDVGRAGDLEENRSERVRRLQACCALLWRQRERERERERESERDSEIDVE